MKHLKTFEGKKDFNKESSLYLKDLFEAAKVITTSTRIVVEYNHKIDDVMLLKLLDFFKGEEFDITTQMVTRYDSAIRFNVYNPKKTFDKLVFMMSAKKYNI